MKKNIHGWYGYQTTIQNVNMVISDSFFGEPFIFWFLEYLEYWKIPLNTTLPETDSSHPKMDGWNTIVSFWGI